MLNSVHGECKETLTGKSGVTATVDQTHQGSAKACILLFLAIMAFSVCCGLLADTSERLSGN